MGQGTLTIYSASAGSGKTFHLARIYLSHLFRSRYNYRKILAVTFTNKATAEMKSRILDQLYCLATGGKSEYLDDLVSETGKSEEAIRHEAGEILHAILHDFSRFSVCTIDAFFQNILRAFAREAGLHSGFNIELDHSIILSTAIDEMIASSADNPEVRNWLTNYVMSNLEEEKSWNLKGEITKLAEELFREKFKILSGSERDNLANKEFLSDYIIKIRSLSSSIEERINDFGRRFGEIYAGFRLTDDMFYQKSRGIPGFIKSFINGNIVLPNDNVRLALTENPRWSTKEPSPLLVKAIEGGLEATLKEAVLFCEANFSVYHSAKAVLSNIFALGILSDVLNKVRVVASDENSFLLSEAGELLSLITGEEQTPFIYEKIGNIYENYMIDEFQDTSSLQWKNFNPLIDESMGRGSDNLVVGDVKQSIYRWRNSDWKILADIQNNRIDNKRFLSKPLMKNWRSCPNIIRFNNSLFSVITKQTERTFPEGDFQTDFRKLYAGALQADPGKRSGGYIRMEFIDDEREDANEQNKGRRKKILRSWKDFVLDRIPSVIEMFQDMGFNASDIGIIVREVKEGEAVVRRMVGYSNNASPEQKSRYNYNIVSGDSLTLSSSHAITFIIAVLKVLCDPDDLITRALMLRFYLMSKGNEAADKVGLHRDNLMDFSHGCFPEGCELFLKKTRELPLFEATENIISFFGLGNHSWNVAYLNAFQDLVMNFSSGKSADIESFIGWWETTGMKKSIALPANQNAARILTIHKAKGLEFKIVILPFLSWSLDHVFSKQPVLWVQPGSPPFNELGLVPVRYRKALADTVFADDYMNEKYSAYIDNINLLYVAMTRARDAIYGFVPESTGKSETIARVIKDALTSEENDADDQGMVLSRLYNTEKRVFEFGEIPVKPQHSVKDDSLECLRYPVNSKPESLKLRLHSEDYFTTGKEPDRQKINYGKLMHEVFEGINTTDDIPSAVMKLVLQGKIPESDSPMLEKKLISLVASPQVSEWFGQGINVIKEADILLPSGRIRRPDRVILKDDKAVIIDFKFGEENQEYTEQIRHYCSLLNEMGYMNTEGFLWYVDKNKIVTA